MEIPGMNSRLNQNLQNFRIDKILVDKMQQNINMQKHTV